MPATLLPGEALDEAGAVDATPRAMAGSATGIAVHGDYTLINLSQPDGRKASVHRWVRDPAILEETARTYVEVTDFTQMAARLPEHRVILLGGKVGTGRRTTAEMLLWQVAGIDRVAGVEPVHADVTAAELAGTDNLLLRGYGTVLELPPNAKVTIGTLRAFERLARDHKAHLVILHDRTDPPGPELMPYGAAYLPPSTENVLRRHLLRMLAREQRCVGDCPNCHGGCRTAFVDRCLANGQVQAELAADPRPVQIVGLATALAGWSGVDSDLGAALGGLLSRRRAFVARLLKTANSPRQDEKEEDPQAAPRRQAFQIAYAAFDEHPLADVFDAAELLLTILRAVEVGTEHQTRVVFDGGVEQMLRAPDGEGQFTAAEVLEQPRRARLAHPELLTDVLDVVWHDFDGGRRPLLHWLEQLVISGRDAVRQRAAYLAGWLARYDFDEVWAVLIRNWAADERGTIRQAAAWALHIAATDKTLLARIRVRVRNWVRSGSPRLHDTAARAYGTLLGLAVAEESLAELRTLASRDDLNNSAAVARTLITLYDPPEPYQNAAAPAATWRTLVTWHGENLYRLRVHATRGFLLLARRNGVPPYDGWPLLLTSTAGFTPAGHELVALWQTTLTDPTTAHRAWLELRTWLRLADDDPDLAGRVQDLVCRILVGPVAVRGRFYLHSWRSQSSTAGRLLGMPWGVPTETTRQQGEAV
ncbi:hypothetical protein VAB18032_10090 [Micromonospora maris AB-18-032]|uniref:LigA protein n=1 Tax=Micromonospora maris TaxID=1003110 RepID=A0A9X0I7T2_9ACTN|nr:hypothetical protein VAB18032_10090 [Micromonospora maris AB-18-032]KUJ48501.1 hypothetical protein ADL17_05510 [Micromonospora maris]